MMKFLSHLNLPMSRKPEFTFTVTGPPGTTNIFDGNPELAEKALRIASLPLPPLVKKIILDISLRI